MLTAMEFVHPQSIMENFQSVVNQSNPEELKNIHIFYCPQCVIGLVHVLMSIIAFSVFIILPMLEIFIGITYLNECSINQYIPIYLIIAGIISLIILINAVFGVKYNIKKYMSIFL